MCCTKYASAKKAFKKKTFIDVFRLDGVLVRYIAVFKLTCSNYKGKACYRNLLMQLFMVNSRQN